MSKVKPPVVEIICVLDRSGSMGSLSEEVINAFNHFIEKQKKEKGKAVVTLVLFDDQYEKVYEKVKLKKVPTLTSEVYYTRGMTAMYDAIGKAITESDSEDAMVLIQTDGYENASQEYDQKSIKHLIKNKEALDWDFIFLGANIDTVQAGSAFGISASKSVSYAANSGGVQDAFATMDASTSTYRVKKQAEYSLKKEK